MVALITGATRGIGLATAKLFLKNGYRVIITGRNEERLRSVKKSLGENASFLVWDASNTKYAKTAVSKAHSIYGNIDVFVNNAGIVSSEDCGSEAVGFFEKSEKCWDETLNTNLKGCFFAIQAEGDYMRQLKIQGNIVNVCSEMGFKPAAFAYGISKWGVRGLTQGAAIELARYGIVVNAVAPGETATEIIHQPEGEIRKISSPRGIQSSPEEIAADIFFLAQSRNIIGEVLVSDGGRRLL